MKFEIRNRFTDAVQFTAEIECAEDAPNSVKLGLAVKVAVKARANLAGADLADAYLADADLAGAYLADAYLAGADLAGADLADANLAGAYLADANLAGAYLADANLADANLAGADLAGADLAGADLADAYLARADLAGAYLAGANLAYADLAGANLAGAYLADANLTDANLARAKNLDAAEALKIPPEEIPSIPNIDAAILAAVEAAKANGRDGLDMGGWHTCETTHCRAGWAIHLAGKLGYALERRYGPFLAGCLIYQASRPGKAPPHFFASNETAMADIRQCAAEQSAQS